MSLLQRWSGDSPLGGPGEGVTVVPTTAWGSAAVAGKRGTGKTTFSPFIRYLVEQGETPVLAAPMPTPTPIWASCWFSPLGVGGGAAREEFRRQGRAARYSPRLGQTDLTEYCMHQAVAEGPGRCVGDGRPEGPGCYCFANSSLREHVNTLAGSYRWGGGHGQRGRFGAPQPACLPPGGRDVPTLRSFTATAQRRCASAS